MISKGPLIVRLCNWVGEAVLSLPTLTMLAEQGHELHLIGKGWASSLFEGHGWATYTRPRSRKAAITQLRSLRRKLSASDAGFAHRPNYLLFTNSFSSALEGRLAGLRPIGYRLDGRGFMLAHSVPRIDGLHAADNYWRLGTHFAHIEALRPANLGLHPSVAQDARANDILLKHGLSANDFVILCPFSGSADTTGKKHWPLFPHFAQCVRESGLSVVLCPGPGEEHAARADYPQAVHLIDVDLGTYAALAAKARCTVSNDTGPGHLAAAVNGRLVSVLGPDAANMWLPQGEHVHILKPAQGWPSLDEALSEMQEAVRA